MHATETSFCRRQDSTVSRILVIASARGIVGFPSQHYGCRGDGPVMILLRSFDSTQPLNEVSSRGALVVPMDLRRIFYGPFYFELESAGCGSHCQTA